MVHSQVRSQKIVYMIHIIDANKITIKLNDPHNKLFDMSHNQCLFEIQCSTGFIHIYNILSEIIRDGIEWKIKEGL